MGRGQILIILEGSKDSRPFKTINRDRNREGPLDPINVWSQKICLMWKYKRRIHEIRLNSKYSEYNHIY